MSRRERSITVTESDLDAGVMPVGDAPLGIVAVCLKCCGPKQRHLHADLPCATCEAPAPRLVLPVPGTPSASWLDLDEEPDLKPRTVEFVRVPTGVVVDAKLGAVLDRRVWVRA